MGKGGRYDPPALMTDRPGPRNPWAGMSTGLVVTAELLSALLVWGGIGYLVDRLAGTTRVFTGIGMILGAIAGIYLVYLRHGRGNGEAG